MIFLIYLATLPFLYQPDPAPGVIRGKAWSRNLECERVDAQAGSRRFPGEIEVNGPRGDFVERSALICKERMVRLGLRAPRDEAILASLDERASDLASTAQALRPDLAGRTWMVETHYPNAQVAEKVTFATKNELVGRGLVVTDRRPMLGVGDIDVITRMPPRAAYPAACQRYFGNGSLGADDVLLAVVGRDARETSLHGGLCSEGRWSWLK